MKTESRPYRMQKRAISAELTRERIAGAALQLFLARWYDEVTLRDIAAAAGVSLQTVVNHFESKEGVFSAVLQSGEADGAFAGQRMTAEPDDIRGAVDLLMLDYERTGDAAWRTLALEERVPAVRPWLAHGREGHRAWLERTFPGALAGLRRGRRDRQLMLLIAATDVYTWKLLRRDQQLGMKEAASCVRTLMEALYNTNERGTK